MGDGSCTAASTKQRERAMPDLPPSKRRPRLEPAVACVSPGTPGTLLPGPSNPSGQAVPVIRYAELHCKTNFSFLRGASHPDELVNRAVELGYTALAITDRNSLAGVVRAHVAAKAIGLKLIIGAEITPDDGPPLLLYAPDIA